MVYGTLNAVNYQVASVFLWCLLLEEDGSESRVERADTLSLGDLAETADEAGSELGVRDETDTGSLERAEGNVGEELGACGGSEVDGGTVVGGGLVSEERDGLLLEELVSSELEGTLEEVTGKGWASTSQESASTLVCDDLTETTDQTAVVCDWVKLDSGLDAVDIYQRLFFVHRATPQQAAIGWKNSGKAYTSTGVRPPCVTEQQTAPAKANRE